MEITITRGLSELKLLNKKINDAIGRGQFVNVVVGKKPVKGFQTNDEFERKAKADYQSILDLIKRRNSIKSAIVASNASTMVKIGGTEMTVAEAIERKESISYEKALLYTLQSQMQACERNVEQRNLEVEEKLQRLLEQNFGKEAKAKDDEVEAISKPYREVNEAKVLDPLNIRTVIEKMINSIDEFESEVDFVLSESNTITKIVIPD